MSLESVVSCLICAWEHLGDAEQQLREAGSATPSSDRRRLKMKNAVDSIYQAERRHLVPQFQDLAIKARDVRKKVESRIFDGDELTDLFVDIGGLRETIWGLYEKEIQAVEAFAQGPKTMLKDLERETAERVITHLSKKYNVPKPKITIVENCPTREPSMYGAQRDGEIVLCKGGVDVHKLAHEFKHYWDFLQGKPCDESGAERFALQEVSSPQALNLHKTVKYEIPNKNRRGCGHMVASIMDLVKLWGPQHVAKGIERGLIEVDKLVVGWPVQPSLLGNLGMAAVGAIGAFMTGAPIDEFLAIMGGHHSTTLWDYLEAMLAPPAVARAGYTYIPTTGQFVPTRPGLATQVKYAPEQRVFTAPKFVPGVLRPKYQLGS